MKIKYEFVNGDISEVEIEGEVAELAKLLRKKGEAQDKKEQRHTVSLDSMPYEGSYFADAQGDTINEILERALSVLTPIQRRRFELFADGRSTREIAHKEGVCQSMVCKSIRQSQAKMQNFLKKTNYFSK